MAVVQVIEVVEVTTDSGAVMDSRAVEAILDIKEVKELDLEVASGLTVVLDIGEVLVSEAVLAKVIEEAKDIRAVEE
jgi:SHS2 domain-containing protein